MKLQIISAKSPAINVEVTRVSLPAVQGPFVVLKNHAPIIAALEAGEIRWNEDGVCRIRSGFAKVQKNNIIAVVEE